MAVTIAFLDPALAAVLAREGLDLSVDAQVLFEPTDSFESLVATLFVAGPDLVQPTSLLVLLV